MDNKYTLLDNIRRCDKELVLFAEEICGGGRPMSPQAWLLLHVRVLKVVVAAYASVFPTKSLKAETRDLLKKSMNVDKAFRVYRTSTVEETQQLLREVING